jgi:hypothetical protein
VLDQLLPPRDWTHLGSHACQRALNVFNELLSMSICAIVSKPNDRLEKPTSTYRLQPEYDPEA